MKKLFVLVFIFGAYLNSNAQGIEFGIKGGATFANISDAGDGSNKTGFLAGAFLGIKPTDVLVIQPEVLFSQQGAEFDAAKFDLSYVNVPVVVKYYLFRGLNIQAGPQFGFLISDDIDLALADVESQIEAETFDLSAVAGVGFDFELGIRIDARYQLGLNDVVDGLEGKNSVFSIALGYNFL
ncbi:porin family protein [Cochleicola gelatinilyticus]|uniref:Outer membrane protein beta-barrel domain-containing protein n=1 Tax=Cochleicola gelatinilyticus TaxID=1763537 RepID=A0A167H358_9FLAO|nr:porin family protein [Cochleicola gelatinilyticus]OAB78167.1 hypothetical protein ULVI_11845 [Cochleicola gelatinilyticus]